MNTSRIHRRVVLSILVLSFAIYIGVRLYAQYRHIDIYVSSDGPMPAELAKGLHAGEHSIGPLITVESPYEAATNKILNEAEIKRVRRTITWGSDMPAFVDSLTIQSPTQVLARRITSRTFAEYQLTKRRNRWVLQSSSKSSRPNAAN